MMAAAGVDGDDETYEWLANAAVRSVEFVTVRLRGLRLSCCCSRSCTGKRSFFSPFLDCQKSVLEVAAV